MNPNAKVLVSSHPVFKFAERNQALDLPTPYILFLGRIREYKGVPILIGAFEKLQNLDIRLIIAGEGQIRSRIPKGSVLINRWLLEEEISELIARAEIIAFPYLESSQSGLIPYCIEKNKKIVITPSSGLLEQSKGYANLIVSEDFTQEGFSTALRSGIHMSVSNSAKRGGFSTASRSIEECLIELI
jgi:glycosyltransferase involved in cell wall biosynthesis